MIVKLGGLPGIDVGTLDIVLVKACEKERRTPFGGDDDQRRYVVIFDLQYELRSTSVCGRELLLKSEMKRQGEAKHNHTSS